MSDFERKYHAARELYDEIERLRAELAKLNDMYEQQSVQLGFFARDCDTLRAAVAHERGCDGCWQGESCGRDCRMNDVAREGSSDEQR